MSEKNNVVDIAMPDFKIGQDKIPNLKIKSLRLQNYKAFEDYDFDFTNKDGSIKNFCCFFGPNGCGKTTALNAIQLVFSRFEGMEGQRLKNMLGKAVRHIDGKDNGVYGQDDFLVTAVIDDGNNEYEVQITKNGFVENYNHSQEIKNLLQRIIFYTRFDMELDKFQLSRSKWGLFKELFEAVTGFKIEEQVSVFDESEDPIQAEILQKYVLGFLIHKPNEIISHRECSAGERKIIKSFSTLLNKEYIPRIILVDNVAMHVESGRHLELIESMKKCFPDSQIFATTHSYHISKNFGERNQLYDIRLMHASCIIREEPWRLYFVDEIKDVIPKIRSMSTFNDEYLKFNIDEGEKLIDTCLNDKDISREDIGEEVRYFLEAVAGMFVEDMLTYYKRHEEIG